VDVLQIERDLKAVIGSSVGAFCVSVETPGAEDRNRLAQSSCSLSGGISFGGAAGSKVFVASMGAVFWMLAPANAPEQIINKVSAPQVIETRFMMSLSRPVKKPNKKGRKPLHAVLSLDGATSNPSRMLVVRAVREAVASIRPHLF